MRERLYGNLTDVEVKMKNQKIMDAFQNEFLIVILFALIGTWIMIYLDAFEKLYLFTRTYERFEIDEFAVFLPAFLTIGFTFFSYRRMKQLESEIMNRERLEKVLRENEKRFRYLSITDELTQLYNSRHCYQKLKAEIDRSIRYNRPLSMIMLDVDNFKDYNDKHGHLEGDDVLATLGKVIRESIRRTDSAFRYGGEEFTVILTETIGKDAVTVAERIRERFETEIFSPGPNEKVTNTVSVGVSQYSPDEPMKVFIKRADKALYVAKKQGKNQVSFSKPAHEGSSFQPILGIQTS